MITLSHPARSKCPSCYGEGHHTAMYDTQMVCDTCDGTGYDPFYMIEKPNATEDYE